MILLLLDVADHVLGVVHREAGHLGLVFYDLVVALEDVGGLVILFRYLSVVQIRLLVLKHLPCAHRHIGYVIIVALFSSTSHEVFLE